MDRLPANQEEYGISERPQYEYRDIPLKGRH